MAVYEVFLALGFDVSIRSILDIKENEFDYLQEYFEERESEFGEEHPYKGKDVVAEGLRELELSETYMGDSYGQLDVIESWGGEWLKINWLTNPNDGNVGLIYKAVGTSFEFIAKKVFKLTMSLAGQPSGSGPCLYSRCNHHLHSIGIKI